MQVLRSLGLTPTLLACRSSEPLEESVREKLVGGTGLGRFTRAVLLLVWSCTT